MVLGCCSPSIRSMVQQPERRLEHKSEPVPEHSMVLAVHRDAMLVAANAGVEGSMVPEHRSVQVPGSKWVPQEGSTRRVHNSWTAFHRTNRLPTMLGRR